MAQREKCTQTDWIKLSGFQETKIVSYMGIAQGGRFVASSNAQQISARHNDRMPNSFVVFLSHQEKEFYDSIEYNNA